MFYQKGNNTSKHKCFISSWPYQYCAAMQANSNARAKVHILNHLLLKSHFGEMLKKLLESLDSLHNLQEKIRNWYS